MAERKTKSKTKKTRKKELVNAETALPNKKDSLYLFGGLTSLIIAVYTLISLISYLFSWADDQSLFTGEGLLSTYMQVENSGGQVGLVWAEFLISKLFGLGAFVIPFFFGGVALFCLKIRKVNLLRLFFISIFGCIIVSVMFSFIFSFTRFDSWFGNGAGGSYGSYVTMWLKSMFGNAGAASIIFIVLIAWLVAINNKFVALFNGWIDKLTAPRPKKVADSEAEEAGSEEDEDHEKGFGNSGDSGNGDNGCNGEDIAGDEEEFPEDDEENGGENGGSGEEEDDGFKVVDDEESDDEGIIDLSGKTENPEFGNEDEEEFDGSNDFKVVRPDAPITSKNVGGEERPEVNKTDEDDFLSTLTEDEKRALFDPRLDLSTYEAPTLSLLEDYRDKWYEVSAIELEKNKRQIEKTLANYRIGTRGITAQVGPTVTLYEIVPAPGVRVSAIKRLEQDIGLSLAAKGVRVVTLPGRNAIGIEVANEKPSVVSMLSVLADPSFKESKYDLPVALGKTITNEVLSFDLAKMPHLLVAGATGQGKSVGLNAILTSLLYRKHPSELKLVLVDPKKVELSLYSKLEKHFLAQLPDADEPVITDTQKVEYTLKSLCKEMDSRYDLLKIAGVRGIKEYNEKFLQRRLNPMKGHRFLPYIVVIIDEFADLLMTAGKNIEEPIARLAQLARAIGIHLVIATQRPTTTVITGNIKANFPARIAFMVRSSIDSKTILDEVGANQLIGRGDMLISIGADLKRVQCALIETKEVERIVDFIGSQRGYTTPYYLPEYTGEDKDGDGGSGVGVVDLAKRDGLFEEAAKLVVMHQQGSTSLIQRKMNLGYNRAGRIMDQLEVAGIVGPFEGSKARQVLVNDLTELDARLSNIKDIYG